jgi:hypothetical protein
MTKDEALRIVLKNLKLIEAQDQGCGGNVTEAEAWRSAKRIAWHTINFVEEALAQPEPYPVALISPSKGNSVVIGQDRWRVGTQDWLPLYLHPKDWVGLTNEEVEKIYRAVDGNEFPLDFYAEIEAKLKEKNT